MLFTLLKRDASRLEQVRFAIESLPETWSVNASPVTGSITILHRGGTDTLLSRLSGLGMERDLFRLNCVRQPKITQPCKAGRIVGRSMLALGVAGVLLPIIPGTPFLIAGAALLGNDDPVVARGVKVLQHLGSAWRFLRGRI
jgi:hypothetical protein